jgi:pimeloyl-ACP methyl ester carboxylesterase
MPNDMTELFLEIEEGKKIKYLANRNSGKPKLLMLHGVNLRSEYFEEFFPYITNDYDFYAPDFRGHGNSYRSVEPYTISAYAEDISIFLKNIVGGTCSLVGMSLGGRVGLLLAARHPELIKKLVVVDVGPDVDPDGLDRLIKAQALLPDFFRNKEELAAFYTKAYKNVSRHYIERIIRYGWQQRTDGKMERSYHRAIWNVDTEMLVSDAKLLNSLVPQIAIPVLIIRGGLSDILTPGDAEKFVGQLANGKLVEIPGATHGVMLEESLKCTKLINEFLA